VADRLWILRFDVSPTDKSDAPDFLRKLYGLTRAEANISVNLCKYGDAIAIAQAMGLSANTVRTHLKSAFQKTGVRNQVGLALIVSSVLNNT
jgi:DNA-binding CsgD family transcriptional regulator